MFIWSPWPLSLLKTKLEFPGIVFVIFVQVSAVKEPVSKVYLCYVVSFYLKYTLKLCATLDFIQKVKIILLEADT